MRHADLDAGLLRLARTRGQAFAGPEVAVHQRVTDTEFAAMMRAIAGLPRGTGELDPDMAPLAPWLDRLRQSRAARETERFKLDLALSGNELRQAGRLLRAVRG